MNPGNPRRKRVSPERAGPIRNRLVSTRTNVPGTSSEGYGPPQAPEAPSGGVLRETLECGVRTAYTVIDEYLRRGYEIARANQNQANGGPTMQDDRSNYSNWMNQWGPMAAPMQTWMMAMKAWTDAWGAMMPGMWPQTGYGGTTGYGSPAGTACASPAVSVHVSSHRPAEVTASVDLYPGADCCKLTVGSLLAQGSNLVLAGVSIGLSQGMLRIGVPVAADQPDGNYCGEIKGADGRCAGHLKVLIKGLSNKSSKVPE